MKIRRRDVKWMSDTLWKGNDEKTSDFVPVKDHHHACSCGVCSVWNYLDMSLIYPSDKPKREDYKPLSMDTSNRERR